MKLPSRNRNRQSKAAMSNPRPKRHLFVENLESRRLLNVDWRNPVDSFDVDADRNISPLDVLAVINDINSTGFRTLPSGHENGKPYFDVNGDGATSPLDPLTIINAINAGLQGPRTLTEGPSFVSEHQIVMTAGQSQGKRSIRLDIEAKWDAVDQTSKLQDLFSVYVVDPLDNSKTVVDRATLGTSVFTLNSVGFELASGISTWNGKTLEVDISSVTPRDTVVVKLQLLSNSASLGSRIVVVPSLNEVDAGGTPGTLLRQPTQAIPSPTIDTSALTLSSTLSVEYSNWRYDATTELLTADAILVNATDSGSRNSVVVFQDLPGSVTVKNATGTTSTGLPYISFRNAISNGGLAKGERSDTVKIEFRNTGNIRFPVRSQVLTGIPNRAPVLAAIPTQTVMPGGRLSIQLSSTDADNDRIVFSVRDSRANGQLPTGSVDAGTGSLIFKPNPNDLGSYQIVVTASDGAISTSQTFTLNVVPDPDTTTRISGQVLDVDRSPIVGMKVEIGGVQGLTQSDGSFTLNLGTGQVVSDTLKVRGDLFTGSMAYPFIAEKLAFMLEHDVYARVNNVIDRAIFLPKLDIANGKRIDPTRDTNVTTAAIPGASVFVAAGTLMNQQGSPFTGVLSVTEVPVNLTPAALPRNLRPDLVVTIQPGEMVFATPAPMGFPNRSGWAPGTRMDLWSINPVTGQFEDVGDMQVSADGATVETISGGVRNSSWHFFAPPPPDLLPPRDLKENPDDDCDDECKASSSATSRVELHSGALIEKHDLVSYMSQGVSRGWTLTYDSLRADPRPIVNFGFSNTLASPNEVVEASMVFARGNFVYSVPGQHYWTVSAEVEDTKVALQGDLRDAPSGLYSAGISQTLIRFGQYISAESELKVLHVNTINSQFGSGWGLSGLKELVENPDGSILLIDGNGSESLFETPTANGQPYVSPPGVFSTLERQQDQTFRLTTTDKTVYAFNAVNKLVNVTDRNTNTTSFAYDGQGRLIKITDPVGLETNFSIGTNGKVSQITDPANRITRFEYDVAGNLTRVIDPDTTSRTWKYDTEHHMTGEIDQRGNEEQAVYDFAGRVTKAILKDGSTREFQPIQVRNLLLPDVTLERIPAAVARGSGPVVARVVDANGNVTDNVLDRAGQIVSSSDGAGPGSTYLRNSQNQVVSSTDGRGRISFFEYDSRGNLIGSRDEGSGGNTIIGAISTSGSRNVYSFNGSVGQRLFYDGLASNNDDLRVQLISPTGRQIFFNNDDANEGPFTLHESGSYQIELLGNDGATGDFAFSLFSPTASTETLTLGREVSGTLELPGDQDTYIFNGTVGQRIFYDALPSGNEILRLQLISPTGRVFIDGRDDSENGPITLDEAGSYRLNLFGNGEGTGDYHFRIVEPSVSVAPLTLGVEVSGTLDLPGELDTLTFNGTVGQRIFYDALPSDSDDLRVQLISPTGRLLIDNHDDSNNGPITLDEAGPYRLNLFGNGDGTGNYHFRVVETSLSVASLTLGMDVSGSLDLPGDLDTFTFNGTVGQRIFYDALPSDNDDLRVQLISPTGRLFINNHDDSNNGPITLDEAGPYRLNLFGNGDGTGDYRFRIVEPSVSVASLTLGVDVSGTLDLPGDLDTFTFNGTVGQRIFYDAITSDNDDLRVQLISPTGGLLIENHDDSNNGPITLEESGSYRFNLFGNGDGTGNYHFRVVEPSISIAPLTLGVDVSGTLDLPGEQDTFTFNGTVGQRVYYDSLPSSGDIQRVQLVSPTGRLFLDSRDDFNNGPITLDEAGPYRLNLFGNGDGTGDYHFQLLDLASTPLVVGSMIESDLQPGMATAFRFTGTKGQRLLFDSQQSGNANWFLEMGSSQVAAGNVGMGEDFTITLPADGPYTLVFSSFDNTNPVTYKFQVTDVSDVAIPTSGLNIRRTGSIAAGQVQSFTFNAPAGQSVFFNERSPSRSNGLRAELRDPQNQQVFLSDEMGSRGPIILQRSGTYTLQISGDSSTDTGNFDFTLVDLDNSAMPIAIGTPQTGNLGPYEVKPFSFQAVSGQRFFYDSLDNDFDNVSSVLISPSGTTLFNQNSDANFGPMTITEAGTYKLLIVNNVGSSSQNYDFRPLSPQSTSASLTIGATVNDQLSSPGDQKEYTFNGSVGQRIFYDSLQGDFSGGQRVRLITPSGVALFNDHQDRNYGPFTLTESGTYRLLLNCDSDAIGTFSFRIIEPAFVALPITIGATVSDQLASPGDQKEFTFPGSVGQQIFYDSLQSDFGGGQRVRLFTPSGAIKFNDHQDNNYGPFILTESGTYRLLMTGDGDATGTFSFRLMEPSFISQSITIGTTVSNQLSTPGDQKEYTFTGSVGQRIFYDSLQSDFGGGQRVRLFTPSGVAMINDHQDRNYGPFTLTESGEYRLLMTGDGDAIGTFSFRIFEPTFVSQPLTMGSTVNDQLASPGDQKEYTFTGSVGQRIFYDSLQSDFSGGQRVRLFTPSGAAMFNENQDRNYGPFTLTESGLYRLLLTGDGDTVGTYSFRIIEPTFATHPLTLGATVNDRLASPGDQKEYTFTGSVGQRFFYDSLQNDFGGGQRVRLFSPSGALLFNENQDTNRGPFTLTESGAYRLRLTGDDEAIGPFSFRLLNLNVSSAARLDAALSGTIPLGLSSRFFQLNGVANQRLFFDSLQASNLSWSLYGPGNAFLVGDGSFGDFETTLSHSGTYLLELRNNGTSTAVPYEFRIVTPETTTAPLELNEVTTGTIGEPGERDIFTFTAGLGQKFVYDSQQNDFAGIQFKIVSPSGTTVLNKNTDDESYPPVTLAETGVYQLIVSGNGDLTGSYRFRLLNASTSTGITTGSHVASTLAPGLATDVYRFSAPAGLRVSFDFKGTSGFNWDLFGPSDACIACGMSVGLSSPISFPGNGTYTLAIRGTDASATPDYDFTVINVSDIFVTPIGLPIVQAGNLAPLEEKTFTFVANSGTKLLFDSLEVDNRIMAELRDPANAVVFSRSAGADFGPISLERSGSFTLTVRNSSASEAAGFSFRLIDLANAITIASSGGVSGSLSVPYETDAYAFNASAGQRLYFDARESNLGVIRYRLIGPDGRMIYDSTADLGLPPMTITLTGRYIVLVGGSQSTTGNYSFRLADVLADAKLPRNRLTSDATTLGVQADVFRFDGQANETVSIQTTSTSGGARAFLYNAGNSQLASIFVGTSLDVTLPASGEYVLVFDSNGTFTQSYTLRIATRENTKSDIIPRTLPSTAPGDMSTTYDPVFNQPTRVVDELGRQTLYTIDSSNGNRLSKTRVVGLVGGNDDLVTTYTYTAQGLIDTITDPLGRITDYEYDTKGRMTNVTYAKGTIDEAVMRYEYDLAGNPSASIDGNNNRTEYQFDTLNRMVKAIAADPDGPGPLTSPITTVTYDAVGNVASTTDANNRTSVYHYDKLNRLNESIASDPDGSGPLAAPLTRFTFDPAGNMDSIIDPNGNSTRFKYDQRNRRIETIDPDGGVTKFAYDLDDNLIKLTDPVGNVTEFLFDARNRVVEEIDPLGNSIHFSYDAVDNLVQKTDRNGRVTSYSYDELNRLVTEDWLSAEGSVVNTVTYNYDKANNLISASDKDSQLTLVYDARNRVATVDNNSTPAVPRVRMTYTYDDVGNILSVSDAINGGGEATSSYTYDGLNRNTSIRQTGSGVSPKLIDMVYNQLGQYSEISRYSDLTKSNLVARTRFQYDQLNRLYSLEHGSATNARDLAFYDYQYDPASRIASITDIDGRTNYAYDKRDQLVGADRGATDTRGDETYNYDANGNRVSSSLHGNEYVTGPGNRLLSDGTYNYQYDQEGSMIRRTVIASGEYRTFVFDHRNRLVEVSDFTQAGVLKQIVRTTYDVFGRRISKTVDLDGAGASKRPETTHFVYDGDHVILDFFDADASGTASQPSLTFRYLFGPGIDQILSQESVGNSQVQWMLTDHLGTVRDVVDNSTTKVNHIQYDSFGNVLSKSDPSASLRYLFTGRELDSETMLYYFRARFFDASTGRFMSEDQGFMGFSDASDYRYSFNNPIVWRDPSGRFFGEEQLKAAWKTLTDLKNAIKNAVDIVDHGQNAVDWVDRMYWNRENYRKLNDIYTSELATLSESLAIYNRKIKEAEKNKVRCQEDADYLSKLRADRQATVERIGHLADEISRTNRAYETFFGLGPTK